MNAFRPRRAKSQNGYDILPPETLGSKPVRRALTRGIVEDAEFVTVKDSVKETESRRTPAGFHNDNINRPRSPRRPQPQEIAQARETVVARLIQRIEQRLLRMSADFFSAVVAFIFVMVFGLSGGIALIAAKSAPEPAGLDITNVSLAAHDSGGMQILQIHGIIENRGATTRKVQPIQADLLVGNKVVFSTKIDPPTAEIKEYQSRGFTARIPHPGGKNPQLKLSFIQSDATAS